MSSADGHGINDLTAALVLRSLRGKSADFLNAGTHLHHPLVLPRAQQYSPQMAEKVGPHRTKLILSNVPREMRKRRRKL
jgi:hypothetical protein